MQIRYLIMEKWVEVLTKISVEASNSSQDSPIFEFAFQIFILF